MNFIYFSLISFALYTFFFILMVPISFRNLFPLLPIVSIAYITFLKKSEIRAFFLLRKKEILISFLFLIVFIFVSIERWKVEPFGMWDSWANWNLKTKYLSTMFLSGKEIVFPVSISVHPEYPIALPGLYTFLNLISFEWSIYNSYFLQILIIFMILFSLLTEIKGRILQFLSILIIFSNIYFIQIGSDLCAELFLSLVLLLISIQMIKSTNAENQFNHFEYLKLGSLIGSTILIKNEGLLIFTIAFPIVLFNIYIGKHKEIRNKEVIYFLLGSLPLFLFQIVYKEVFSGTASGDFSFSKFLENESLSQKISHHFVLVLGYFKKILLIEFKGLFFISILIAFFSKNRIFISLGFFFLILLVGYNVVYIFSIHDLEWHLNTSYHRIHLPLLPSLVFLMNKSIQNLKFNQN